METRDVWNVQISESENKKAARVQSMWSKVKIILQAPITEAFESLYYLMPHAVMTIMCPPFSPSNTSH